MSLSSTFPQILIFAQAGQLIVAMAESIYTPLSAGLLYGVFISQELAYERAPAG